MFWGLKRAIKYHLGTDIVGRNLEVHSDDTFIVSYPRSGNTWTRFLVANLVHPEKAITFANIDELTPDCELISSREAKRIARPRIIKSHQYFDPRYKRVIYLTRDPRDVVISQYHLHRKKGLIADQFPISEYVTRFLEGRTCFYGSWGDHVSGWRASRTNGAKFLLLRYEDMVENTLREVSRVDAFLGLGSSPGSITRAVERSSVSKMQQLEKAQAQLFSSTKGTRQDIAFVRAGRAGGWRSELPEDCAHQIEDKWGDEMRWLGHDVLSMATEWTRNSA